MRRSSTKTRMLWALILLGRWCYANHLLTYLLTIVFMPDRYVVPDRWSSCPIKHLSQNQLWRWVTECFLPED